MASLGIALSFYCENLALLLLTWFIIGLIFIESIDFIERSRYRICKRRWVWLDEIWSYQTWEVCLSLGELRNLSCSEHVSSIKLWVRHLIIELRSKHHILWSLWLTHYRLLEFWLSIFLILACFIGRSIYHFNITFWWLLLLLFALIFFLDCGKLWWLLIWNLGLRRLKCLIHLRKEWREWLWAIDVVTELVNF